MTEFWLPIPGYEGYEASNFGRIKSLGRYLPGRFSLVWHEGCILQPCPNKQGYLRVCLSVKNKRLTKKVHRLVAFAFIANTRNCPQINHKDGNKANNIPDNLEWMTCAENFAHGIDTGLLSRPRGEKAGSSRLKAWQVLEIRARQKGGEKQIDLAAAYGMSNAGISTIVRRVNWRHI